MSLGGPSASIVARLHSKLQVAARRISQLSQEKEQLIQIYHYQLQFNENTIKSLLKTQEPIFHGHENGDSPFHGLCQAHENSIRYYLT